MTGPKVWLTTNIVMFLSLTSILLITYADQSCSRQGVAVVSERLIWLTGSGMLYAADTVQIRTTFADDNRNSNVDMRLGSRQWCLAAHNRTDCHQYGSTMGLDQLLATDRNMADLAASWSLLQQSSASLMSCFWFGAGISITMTLAVPALLYLSSAHRCLRWSCAALTSLILIVSLLALMPSVMAMHYLHLLAAWRPTEGASSVSWGPILYLEVAVLLLQLTYVGLAGGRSLIVMDAE